MIKVVGIRYDDNNKIYYFDANNLDIKEEEYVIVDSDSSIQIGKVVQRTHEVDPKDLGRNLKKVIRIATKKDLHIYDSNKIASHEALINARKLVAKLKLNMILIDANYNFDRSQLLFHFVADSRVDFRELAKKLAQTNRSRIELRQIGVRDKAKMIGGLGPCGRFLCCSSFLTDFNSVSINMAKNQMLALNPSKINGICGRLLCCLEYEDEIYTEMKKGLPSLGSHYKKDNIEGKVISLNLVKRTAIIETKALNQVEVMFSESVK